MVLHVPGAAFAALTAFLVLMGGRTDEPDTDDEPDSAGDPVDE